MATNQNWDYAAMCSYAGALRELRDASIRNKTQLDNAMAELIHGLNAEAGMALTQAYQNRVSSVDMFHRILDEEANTLERNVQYMQAYDRELAAKIRSMFM